MDNAGKQETQPFNLQELNELYGATTVLELLQMTVDEAVGLLKDLRQAVADHDLKVVMVSAHQMKGLSATMTINHLSKLSLDLETAARHDSWDGIPGMLSLLEEEFKHVSFHIASVLKGTQYEGK